GVRGELDAALECFYDSVRIAREVGDRRQIADVMKQTGYTLLEHGYDEACFVVLRSTLEAYSSLPVADTVEVADFLERIRPAIDPETMSRIASHAAAPLEPEALLRELCAGRR